MSLDAELAALHGAVTVAEGEHLACVKVGGARAHEVLDRVSPRQLFVRSGQMLHTLLLDEAARPLGDVYVCCDDDCYYLVVEGMPASAVLAYLCAHGGADAELTDVGATHAFLTVEGPYAWELLVELTTPDVIGLPYLGFFHDPQLTCFRAGKTGEYGYDLLIPRASLDAVRARIHEVGQAFELQAIGRATQQLAMLEAGFFDVSRAVRDGLTPVELQLQWRVTAGRSFPGAEALAARRRAPRGRAIHVAAEGELPIDAAIHIDGEPVGSILVAGRSATRGEWLGLALLAPAYGHAGLAGFTCAGTAVRTISAPAINHRSLYVDPQRHAWATRATTAFPPLLRPGWS